jgi:hypothetical protein
MVKTSWIIRNKATKQVIAETWSARVVNALNTAKYEAVPVQQHLAELNESIKKGIENENAK